MDQHALVVFLARPVRHVGLFVVVIALAHPQEVRGKDHLRAVRLARCFHRPQVGLAVPRRLGDAVAVMDVRADPVLLDHFAHIVEDRLGRGNRRADPRLEAIAKGVEVRVGTDAGVLVGFPGSAERVLHFQDGIGLARTLILQVIGRTDPGNPGANDQYVNVGGLLCGNGRRSSAHHRLSSSVLF